MGFHVILVISLLACTYARTYHQRELNNGFPVPNEDDLSMTLDDIEEQQDLKLNKELADYKCNPLEDIFEGIVNSSAIDLLLKAMEAENERPIPYKSSDELFGYLKTVIGYDLRKHHDRHSLACKLYGIHSINDLSAFLGVPLPLANMYYQGMVKSFNQTGLKFINVYLDVSVESNMWVAATGYPNMPNMLKSNFSAVQIGALMERWQGMLISAAPPDLLLRAMLSLMVPLRILPQYTVSVFSVPQTTDSLRDLMAITDFIYQRTQMFDLASMRSICDLILLFKAGINEISKMGLLALEIKD